MSAARYAIELEKESKARQLSGLRNVGSLSSIEDNEDSGRSVAKAADKFKIGQATVERAVKVEKQGAEELKQAVETGRASVSAAAEVATLPVDEQREIVAKGEAEILKAAKDIRAKKTEARRAEREERAAIKEFDAGMTRDRAESEAANEYREGVRP